MQLPELPSLTVRVPLAVVMRLWPGFFVVRIVPRLDRHGLPSSRPGHVDRSELRGSIGESFGAGIGTGGFAHLAAAFGIGKQLGDRVTKLAGLDYLPKGCTHHGACAVMIDANGW